MSGGQSIWYQKEVSLPSKKRGCHLVTEDIERNVPELQLIKIGLAHVHSASHVGTHMLFTWTDTLISDAEMCGFFQLLSLTRAEFVLDDCWTTEPIDVDLRKFSQNWDPDVRVDTEMMLNKIVPEGQNYLHSCEGPDDMPAHIKATLIGSSVTIPITDGKFNLGTWQGLWLCEHRNHGGSRKVVVTVQGVKK